MRSGARPSILVHALAALVTCWLAAGCGDGTGDETDDAGTDAATSAQTADPGSGGSSTTGLPASGPYAVADLTVTVTHPDVDPLEYRIACLGDTATVSSDDPGVDTVIDAPAACEALARPEVVRRLTEGPPPDQVCTEIYGGPDEAVLRGTIGAEEVDATVDRRNGCAIADWDDLLAAVLPPARGVEGP